MDQWFSLPIEHTKVTFWWCNDVSRITCRLSLKNQKFCLLTYPLTQEVSFIAEQYFLVKIEVAGRFGLGLFTAHATCLRVVRLLQRLDFVTTQAKILPLADVLISVFFDTLFQGSDTVFGGHCRGHIWVCALSTVVGNRFTVAWTTDSAERLCRPHFGRGVNRNIILVINLHYWQTLFRSKSVRDWIVNQIDYKSSFSCQKDQLREKFCLIENHTSEKSLLLF